MSAGFFLVGGVIFSIYVYFLVWNIYTSNKQQREENYPNYQQSQGMVDSVDKDGHGNYGRFPKNEK